MPPGLVSNLQEALLNRKITPSQQDESNDTVSSTNDDNPNPNSIEFDESKPIILLTNSDGVESPGLTHLVEALVLQNLYNVHVCVPQSCVLFLIYLRNETNFRFFLLLLNNVECVCNFC